MGYSFKGALGNESKKTNDSPVYLRVIINRNKKDIPLGFRWPRKFFNNDTGLCKKISESDKDYEDYNLIINDEKARANEIFKRFRLSRQTITLERFVRSWEGFSDSDLISYMKYRSKEKLREKQIKLNTYKAHKKVIKKLEQWRPEISFMDLDELWAEKFDSFMQRTIKSRIGNTTNTRWNHHKTIKSYLKDAAEKEHFVFINPYEYFTTKTAEGTWKPLSKEDVKSLINYYREPLKAAEKKTLRMFLFSVFTGLRISDLNKVNSDMIRKQVLHLPMEKNSDLNKHLEIPLTSFAQELVKDAQKEVDKGVKLFAEFEEQYTNRLLKKIGAALGIKTNLHHHAARHTFITRYLAEGGRLEVAQDLAGHSDIKTTMKYVHVDLSQKKDDISVLEKLT